MFEEKTGDRSDKDEVTREGYEGNQGKTKMRRDVICEPGGIFVKKADVDLLGGTESASGLEA